MTVPVQVPSVVHTGNGITKAFPYPYLLLLSADISITVDGVTVSPTAYTVTGVGAAAGGSVIFSSAPAALSRIIMRRDVGLARATDYQYAGDFLAATVNKDFDRIWMALQDQSLNISTAIRFPSDDPTNPLLPSASGRALTTLGFDAAGGLTLLQPSANDATGLALALISSSLPSQGAGLVGYDGGSSLAVLDGAKTLQNYAALRAYAGRATGVRITTAGIAGQFYRDSADVSTPDNGGTVVVDALLRRWRRIFDGAMVVKWFGAKGDGVTEDTLSLNAANATATAAGRALYWPAGTYISGRIDAIANMRWIGEGATQTIVKLKSGANVTLLGSPNNECNDVHIQGMQFDGNRANNALGACVDINGVRTRLLDLIVVNAPGEGIVTTWNPSVANLTRLYGAEGYFSNITINATGRHGWLHEGPGDSHFENIIIIDAGLSANNSFYGIYLKANGRFFNLHIWNEYFTNNVPAASCYVESSGNNFSACHFEGGMLSLNVVGSGNTFASCSYYAPRGTHTVQIAASAVGNCLHGSLGLGAFGGNLEYKGILLIGPGNIIDVTNVGSGCVLGAIDFGSDMGNNFVRVNGYQPKGSITFGTPHVSDDVLIAVTGITGQNYSQQAPVAWVPFVPVISSIVGAISTVSASGRYKRNGKTIHFQMSIFVTANGTGSGGLVATLPANALSDAVTSGRENSTGKMVQGQIQSGTALMRLFDYANNYPATSGTPLVVSGTYETV